MGKRIALRLTELNWDQVELCNRVEGLEPQALSAVIKRDSGRSKFAAGIAQAMGVDLNWLMTGEGKKETTGQTTNNYPREIEVIVSAAMHAYNSGALSTEMAEAHAGLFRALVSSSTSRKVSTTSNDISAATLMQIATATDQKTESDKLYIDNSPKRAKAEAAASEHKKKA
ncbi:helix-turn-helix domain containing protein [Deefgea piscis]|uniref:helix-turn-helix domain containing protein n=1 Tax=Deefgea piscis TaxID=2739061 RepID=UPI001C81BD83|nr:helix-turn-helix domain containing protein [Deefgea piscis]QZA80203.1 helix-turn-helix domain containing protein [Deefgea piscis]